jgi:hypothetical protein
VWATIPNPRHRRQIQISNQGMWPKTLSIYWINAFSLHSMDLIQQFIRNKASGAILDGKTWRAISKVQCSNLVMLDFLYFHFPSFAQSRQNLSIYSVIAPCLWTDSLWFSG